jgi:hypothetical protein
MYMRQQGLGKTCTKELLKTIAMIAVGICCTSRLVSGFTLVRPQAKRTMAPQRLHQMVLENPMMSTSSLPAATDNDDSVLEVCVVCGPSGVGKGTIINKFMEEMGGKDVFGFTVSHTTRAPREGEIDGTYVQHSSVIRRNGIVFYDEYLADNF